MTAFLNCFTSLGSIWPPTLLNQFAHKLHADQWQRRRETDDPQEKLRIEEQMSQTRDFMTRMDMARMVAGIAR